MGWEGRRGGVRGFRIGKYFSDPSPKLDDLHVVKEGCLLVWKKCVFLQFCLTWEIWERDYLLINTTYFKSNKKIHIVKCKIAVYTSSWDTCLEMYSESKTVTKYFERLYYLVVGVADRWHQSKTYFPLQETCKTWKKIFKLSLLPLYLLHYQIHSSVTFPKLVFLTLFVLLTVLASCQKALFRGWFYYSEMVLYMFCCILADWEVFVTMHVTTEPLLTSGNPCTVCHQ